MSVVHPYEQYLPQIANQEVLEARYTAFDDSWAVEYEAREAMIAVRDGNNAEFFRLYPQNAEHKDELFVVAVDFGNLEAAQYLYEQGADVNGEDLPDDCPFMFAMRSRNLEMIAWMLTLPDMDANVQMDCDGYYNGLAYAIDNNFPLTIIDKMMDCGAEINEENGIFYPLSMAAHKNNAPAAALLLLRGGDSTYVYDDDQSVSFYASGPLKTALENWSERATLILNCMLYLDPSLIARADFANVMVYACTVAAEEAAAAVPMH
jgi:ankyrin repeat protein